MMDWTDRHCRFFHRLLAPDALLYTEMITARAIIGGDPERLLGHAPAEQPLALQLGGAVPEELGRASWIAAAWGFAEINLNVGCPSPRVSAADFGAALMKDPGLVRACLQAMRAEVAVPVTVKHRIGVDELDDYDFLCRFVAEVATAGVSTVIVHARKALLSGLSPKENRSIPPLIYERVYRLKRDFPELTVVLNGGVDSLTACQAHLEHVDGVMLGRKAYEDPWLLTSLQTVLLNPLSGRNWQPPTRFEVVEAMADYAAAMAGTGVRSRHISRHMLGLFHGLPGARAWRRWLSDPQRDRERAGQAIRGSLQVFADKGVEANSCANKFAPTAGGDL